MKFSELGLNDALLRVIDEQKFSEPSDIQDKTIPLVLKGKDVIAESATGSGKTLAFASGIIQHAEKGKGIRALVLTPTRELAEQVSQDIIKFSKYKPLNVLSIYGGVSITPQISALKHADVVIGTPGRILDHLERGTINLKHVQILVLDEADRMLDMGFIDDVKKITSQCPKDRQTLLFSATISSDIIDLSHSYMRQPTRISVEHFVDPTLLKQVYYDVHDNVKFSLLVHFLKKDARNLSMVFCNTQRTTDFVAKNLSKQGIEALAIHGGFTQAKRSKTMEEFHKMKFSVLVCTDVASRGLDIKGVSHVYNYDIPMESKSYVHRIGRTARAGKEGMAINLLSSRDHDNFSQVLRDSDIRISKEELPEFERVNISVDHHSSRGGFSRNKFSRSPRTQNRQGGRR